MPSAANWLRLDLEVTSAAVEAAAALLREIGAGGVVIEDPSAPPVGFFDFDARPQGGPTLVGAYFPMASGPAAKERLLGLLDRLSAEFGPVQLRDSLVSEADWAERWREHYHPFRVGDLWIAPPWEAPPRPGEALILDPGPAFGTGLHPTTRLCLGYLARDVKPGSAVLDLGTGSGILGLAALKWGAAVVTALDVDPGAVRAARENAARNDLSSRFTAEVGGVEAAAGPYDLAVANIVAEVVRAALPGLYQSLKPGGVLLASGLLAESALDWTHELARAGFTLLGSHRLGSWVALRARRQP